MTSMIASRDHRERRLEAFIVLRNGRTFDRDPTWDEMFDGLPDEVIIRLGELYPTCTPAMQAAYAARFGAPEL